MGLQGIKEVPPFQPTGEGWLLRVFKLEGSVVEFAFLKEPLYGLTPYMETGRPLRDNNEPGCGIGMHRGGWSDI